MVDHAPIDEHFPVVVTAAPADEHPWVLKDGETFAVFNHVGDLHHSGLGEQGLYHAGTRFLSRLTLQLGHQQLLLLSARLNDDSTLLTVDLTNPDVTVAGQLTLPHGSLHLARSVFLWRGVAYLRLAVRNYGPTTMATTLAFFLAADYADLFEVRGATRDERGQPLPAVVGSDRLVLGYRGLDGVERRTRLTASPAPTVVTERQLRFALTLAPHAEWVMTLTIACEIEPAPAVPLALPYAPAYAELVRARRERWPAATTITTSNAAFNDWLHRSQNDLTLLTTETAHGPFPYAGIPWFSTVFGRDGILAALACLWVNPELARGVLAFLAANQATTIEPEQEAEPGRILHELRQGEMAARREIPFGRYYGSVDATPLFVLLAGAYYRRTADLVFIQQLWPAIERALDWLDHYGDVDGDGFIEYRRRSARGLRQQGWKDSNDSIMHADGSLAEGPIALCEVQGYTYAARQAAAELAERLGDPARAAALRRQAAALRDQFERDFWCAELDTYALALDGDKRPCRVRSSNAGQCLFTGIVGAERAQRLAATLLTDASFSGWGIRTLATGERRYNPMSYHNGSVWPHDNALIALGLADYGLKEAALKIARALFDASRQVDLHRLPELFCGFARRPGEGPTLYPVACAPQAWAAAAIYPLLAASLGLVVDAPRAQLCFTRPVLPEWLRSVEISQLRVGAAEVDLAIFHHPAGATLQVVRRTGQLEVITTI